MNRADEFFNLKPHELPANFMDICPLCWMPKRGSVKHEKVCECGFVAEPGKIYFTETTDDWHE